MTRRQLRASVALALLTGTLLLPGQALAQGPAGQGPGRGQETTPDRPLLDSQVSEALRKGSVLLNFENIDIRVLARMMAELTGRNLVLDDRVQGRVTVLSSREVTPTEAWDIFLAALNRYGFTTADRGEYVQVLPGIEARRTSRVLAPGKPARGGDELVMAILIMRQANPDLIQNAVRPLISEIGFLLPYKEGKALILAERASVVARISEVIASLDRLHPTTHTSVVRPRHLEAEKVVPTLQQMFQGQADFKIMAFAPANAVVILGSAPQILDVKRLIERLDVPEAAPPRVEPPRFFVYNLQFAQAEEVARILSEMLAEKKQSEQQAPTPLPESPSAAPIPPLKGSLSANQAALDRPIVPGGAPAAGYPDATGAAARPRMVGFISSKVSADPETNSLLLFISPSQYEELKPVIARLDLERKQVQISAVVAEVSLRRMLDVGVNWQAITDGGVLGSFRGGLTEEGLLNFLASGNFIMGVSGASSKAINVNGRNVNVPEFFLFLSALSDNSDFNLISAPRVLTQDHKEAVMNVGQVVPFATGGRLDAFGQPLVTFDYREVGIKLQVTPHVSQSDMIRMEITQEIQEVTDFLRQELGGTGFAAPIISNRNVTTTVTMKDGQTLIIGGLISKRTVDSITGVPLLKDLPLIGDLFKQRNTDEQKTTVFISITPQIVRTPDELPALERPYQELLRDVANPGDHQGEDRTTRPPADPHEAPSGPSPQTGAGAE